MSDCMNKILQLLNDGREKYDNPSMYQIYMAGILDTLNAVNDLLGSKEDAKAGEGKKPTSFYRETISGRYISTTDAYLYHAEKVMVRRILTDQLYATVNEWFDLLDLPHIENGDKLGWTLETLFGVSIVGDSICYRDQPVELFPQKKAEAYEDIRKDEEDRKETDEKDESETSLYYEPLSGRYFSMPAEDFNSVLNEVMTSGKKSMKVNEWFDMLGLEPLMLAEHYHWPFIISNFAYVTPGASDKAPEWHIHYGYMPVLKDE